MNWNYFYAIPTRLEFGWILTTILSLHCYLWEIQSISLFWSTVHLLGGRGLVKMSDSLFFCINVFNVSNFTHDTWMKNLKVNREVLFPFPFPVISFQINATVLSSNDYFMTVRVDWEALLFKICQLMYDWNDLVECTLQGSVFILGSAKID